MQPHSLPGRYSHVPFLPVWAMVQAGSPPVPLDVVLAELVASSPPVPGMLPPPPPAPPVPEADVLVVVVVPAGSKLNVG